MTLLLILAIVIGFAIFSIIPIYNRLVRLKALNSEAYSGIDVQLKRRSDLIPNLVETVKGYATHEKGVFQEVAALRSVALHAKNIEEKAAAENQLTQSLKTLFAVAENYPELKANQNFIALQSELSSIETELQLSRRYYNGTARNYNTAIHTFPTNLIASLTGFQAAPYFGDLTEEERKAPQVKF